MAIIETNLKDEITDLFIKFLLNGNYETEHLIYDLFNYESEIRDKMIENMGELDPEDLHEMDCQGLWFRFYKDDTLATDIKKIELCLNLPYEHSNREIMVENIENCIGGSLEVTFS